ncbi:MAG: hypothetical protein ACK4KV_06525 [Rhodocyclaceae bacterium]
MASLLRWHGLLSLLVVLLTHSAQAQTIEQNDGSGSISLIGPESVLGQSFVTTLNGTITALGVRSMNDATASLYVYSGGSGSGTSGSVGTPIYTQHGVILSAASTEWPAGGFSNIPLTTPLAITAGQTLTFILAAPPPFGLAFESSDPYTQGVFILDYALAPFPGFDLAFQVFEVAPQQIAPIPTLNIWTKAILALLLTSLAVRALRTRGKNP